jgi:formyltetrahydrofolate-dependent phosphoribosylglycinamide formyltransferase
MRAMRTRIAILASGGGSNLGAILAHLDALGAERNADVALVLSDREQAGALERARARAIAAAVIDPLDAAGLSARLEQAGVTLVVLAGYLKLVPAAVVRAFHGRMMNVHPALLPAFGGPGMYGRRIHRAVIDQGVRLTGVTVHFVDEQYDRGPIIAQWPVPVHESDTPDSLAARVLSVEHRILPRAVEAVAAGRIALGGDGRVHGTLCPDDDDRAFILAPSPTTHT